MENKKIAKSSIIFTIVIVLIIIGILYFIIFNKEEKIEYFTVKGTTSIQNSFIQEYKDLSKIIKKNFMEESTMTSETTFQKYNILNYFNEEFFKNKKLAIICLYEDDSKGYISSIDKVVYNKDKTEATIIYTYKNDGYAGNLTTSWNNYLLVEIDGKVQNVIFKLDNEKK